MTAEIGGFPNRLADLNFPLHDEIAVDARWSAKAARRHGELTPRAPAHSTSQNAIQVASKAVERLLLIDVMKACSD